VFAGICSKDILGLYLSGFEDGLLSLLIELLGHDLKLFRCLGQSRFLILQFIDCSIVLIGELLMVLDQLVVPAGNLRQLFLQDCNFGLLGLDDFAVLVLFCLDEGIELGVVHKHLLFDFRVCDQDFLFEVLALGVGIIDEFLDSVNFDEELGVFDFLVAQLQEALF
jgi:hypothetical protein